MRVRLREHRSIFWLLGLLVLLLSACAPAGGRAVEGSQPAQASPTPPGQASPTSMPTPPPTPGSYALNGCSSAQPPADSHKQADVVVTEKGVESAQPVTLKNAQILEVRLPASMHWHMHLQNQSSALGTAEATGWYDASLKDCLWRFTALKTGTATLSFTGTAICTPKGQCPVAALVQQYDITIH